MWLRGTPSILGEEAQDLLVHRAQVEDAVHPGLQLRSPLFDGLHAVATTEPCGDALLGLGARVRVQGAEGLTCLAWERHAIYVLAGIYQPARQ